MQRQSAAFSHHASLPASVFHAIVGKTLGHRMIESTSANAALQTLLERWSRGDRDALDQLLTHLYRDIHAIAVRQLHQERHSSLRPTALVHEAYLRLAALREIRLQDRTHFLSMAARVSRQALIDEARRRRATKRDGGDPVTLSDTNLGEPDQDYDAIDVDELLTELERFDALAAEVVALRVFGGLSIEEVASCKEISVATVNRRWATGKAWLTRELTRQ
jgi:RNA polymerase sigma factor (TIGR02999 family)